MPGGAAIRFATTSDVPEVHALVERSYRGESARVGWTHEADLLDGQRTNAAELEAIVRDPRSRLLLLEESGQLVGCVLVADRGNATGYLGLLCVDPRRQAAGFGKRLIAAAERHAGLHLGATYMEMTVIEQRMDLIAYYERRGYAKSGEKRPLPVESDPPLALVVLTKALPRL